MRLRGRIMGMLVAAALALAPAVAGAVPGYRAVEPVTPAVLNAIEPVVGVAPSGLAVLAFITGTGTSDIRATVRTTDRTGVEMEALTAVAVAGLTLHDMVKAVDPAAELDAVRVERKEGGKTGTWTRPEERS